MTEQEFTIAATAIADFLGAQSPTASRLCSWMPKVRHIPSEAVKFIVCRITDEADSMPRNLPKAFREKFDAWLKANPNKAAKEAEQAGCRDCEGGVLFLERVTERGWRETAVVFCSCYTGNTGVVGRASLRAMESMGWHSAKRVQIDLYADNQAGPAMVAGYMEGAKRAERRPDPRRNDGYDDEWQ